MNESVDLWDKPASQETVAKTVSTVTTLVEPGISEKRVQVLTQFLSGQGYTEAEIRYAAQELPKDEHLDAKMRYGKPLTPADFERVIGQIRKLRQVLNQKRIPEDRVDDLVEEMDQLSREDFGQMGFDAQDNPVYTIKAEARERLEGDHEG